MKKLTILFTITFFSISFGYSQFIPISTLANIRSKQPHEIEEYLITNNWSFIASEKSEELDSNNKTDNILLIKPNALLFGYDYNNLIETANIWFLLEYYFNDSTNKTINLQFKDLKIYNKYITNLKSNNIPIKYTYIDESKNYIKVYQGKTTTFQFTIVKNEDNTTTYFFEIMANQTFKTREVVAGRNEGIREL